MNNIAVVGLGRLGICLALNLERCGYHVVGIDVANEIVERINNKTLLSPEPNVSEMVKQSSNFQATTQVEDIFKNQCRFIFVVVQTPSKPNGEFDHAYIDQFLNELYQRGSQSERKCIIINSTCMPGYCASIESKLDQLNYDLIYNPEFIAQGSIIRDQQSPDQVLIGGTFETTRMQVQSIYERMCINQPVYCHMSLISAEITKLATNCFLTNKIAFANAIGDIATACNAEPEKILNAIGVDRRIGNQYLKYGYGYGGPCFPRDNKAFSFFSNALNYPPVLFQATDTSNDFHHGFLLNQKKATLNPDAFITFNNVCYKEGSDILEESQQLRMAVDLAKSGFKVEIVESKNIIQRLVALYGDLFIYRVNE